MIRNHTREQSFQQAIAPVSLDIWAKTLGPVVVFIGTALVALSSSNKHNNRVFSWTVLWLLLSGIIHLYIELWFVFFREQWIAPALNLYGASDFRYGSPLEPGTAAMETITAILDGPLCFLAAYGFVHRKGWYHPLILTLCTMQMYGLVWFCLHPFFSNQKEFPDDPVLFWGICVGMNAPWAIVPPLLWYDAFKHLSSVTPQQKKAHAY